MQTNQLFDENHIILDAKAKSQNEALTQLATLVVKWGYVSDVKVLIAAFENCVFTAKTGYTLLHVRIKEVKKPACFFFRYLEPMSENGTSIIIALILPKSSKIDHLPFLAAIARKLTAANFSKQLQTATEKSAIMTLLTTNTEKDQIESNDKKLILALTACPVGIAHTYLAADKLIAAGKKLDYEVKVETHGASGVTKTFTEVEIKNSTVIIVASDVGLDLNRFAGKKVYLCRVGQAIKDPVGLINTALQESKIHKAKNDVNFVVSNNINQKVGVMKHLMAGMSYMVPIVILGGIFNALATGLTKAIYGAEAKIPSNSFLYYIDVIHIAAFVIMIPILAAFIANSIAGRAAITPALVVAYIGNKPEYFFKLFNNQKLDTGPGFIGAIATGLAVGYTVKWINSYNIPKPLMPIMPIFVIPIIVGFVYAMIMIFVVGPIIGLLMEQIGNWIKNNWGDMNKSSNIMVGFGFGLLIGLMAGFDMGGPVNKIAFLTSSGLITSNIYTPMGAMACAIPVAPIGMGFATIIFRSFFDQEQKTLGITAIFMGCMGLSEGAIPFAVNDPKRVIACNMVGSGIAGAMAGLLGIANTVAHGGPIIAFLGGMGYGNGNNKVFGWASAWSYSLLALLIMFLGALITATMYGFWLLRDKKRLAAKIIA